MASLRGWTIQGINTQKVILKQRGIIISWILLAIGGFLN